MADRSLLLRGARGERLTSTSVAGDVDLIAIVRVVRHDDLADVVTRHVAALPGIVETRTMVAFQAYSKRDLDALWDLGE